MSDRLSAVKRHYRNGGIGAVCRAVFEYYTPDWPFLRAKLRYYRQRLGRGATVHPFSVYTVDPGRITRYVEYSVFYKFPNATRVRNGSWDRDARPLQSLGKYVLPRQYLTGELDARELTYERLREHGYTDFEAAAYTEYGYATYLDELADSLKTDGYRIHSPDSVKSPIERYDHVALNIGRDGELLFDAHGCHRLTIAHVFDVDRIPVRINAIHGEWDGAAGPPGAHPALTYLTRIPLRWRDIYELERCQAKLPDTLRRAQR
jgi:hypothetical protein